MHFDNDIRAPKNLHSVKKYDVKQGSENGGRTRVGVNSELGQIAQSGARFFPEAVQLDRESMIRRQARFRVYS
jgi:hypothetical protein